jgi:hypothetical protein
MVAFVRLLTRWLPLPVGVLGVWFAVERWLWFQTLPRLADARLCGNCFLAAVGIPIELGMLGFVMASGSLLKIPLRSRYIAWCCAAIGVLLTPAVFGVPLFAFTFLALVLPITNTVFKKAIRTVL